MVTCLRLSSAIRGIGIRRPCVPWSVAVALKYKVTPTLSLSVGMDETVRLYGHFLDAGFTKPFPYIAASRDFGTWTLTGKVAQEFAFD